jgi:U3 small nucleolar ribonucleoprotein protein IMP3
MRKLKYHEKKLLKKVNFLDWKKEDGHREAQVSQRYHATHRDDYKKYVLYSHFFLQYPNFLFLPNININFVGE